MPSGSHGGSRGSHSSGGSRSSSSFGGSRGGSHGSSYSRSSMGPSHGGYYGGYHRPFRFRWRGHYYVYSDGARTGLVLLLFFIFFFFVMMLGTFSNVGNYKQEIALIEEDYRYYQDMISYAEAHANEGYIVDGEVVDKFYNPDADRYYIIYEIETPNGIEVEGYTYSIYTLAESSVYRRGDTIKIAVDSVPITTTTDSINLDYKYTTLEDDGDYLSAKASLNGARLAQWGSIVVVVLLVGITLVVAYKKKTQVEDKDDKKEENKVESTTYECVYCGATYSKNEKKCPSCGASLRK